LKFIKQCKTCEYNCSGICTGYGETYNYGETITDETRSCDDWSAGFEYFSEITRDAPWYIREPYQDYKINYSTFEKLLEADAKGKAIEVNIYDAIREIYGLSLVDLAVLLDVTFGVMYRARSVGTPDKRLRKFSKILCIPTDFFKKITTHDFEQLKKCKAEFEQSIDMQAVLKSVPEWKQKLIFHIANNMHCPMHIAKEIARVDKLNWQINSSDLLNDSEKTLVDWVSKSAIKQNRKAVSIEYSLDIAALMHFHARYQNKSK
jgi:hypothetical protein